MRCIEHKNRLDLNKNVIKCSQSFLLSTQPRYFLSKFDRLFAQGIIRSIITSFFRISTEKKVDMPKNEDVKGIGGWLLVLAFGLIVLPIQPVIEIYHFIEKVITDGYWEALTASESNEMLFRICEVAGKSILVLYNVALLFMLFRKSTRFPFALKLFLIANIVFTIVAILLAHSVPTLYAEKSSQLQLHVIRSIVDAAIWILYFRFSKRVKNTFVESKTN